MNEPPFWLLKCELVVHSDQIEKKIKSCGGVCSFGWLVVPNLSRMSTEQSARTMCQMVEIDQWERTVLGHGIWLLVWDQTIEISQIAGSFKYPYRHLGQTVWCFRKSGCINRIHVDGRLSLSSSSMTRIWSLFRIQILLVPDPNKMKAYYLHY